MFLAFYKFGLYLKVEALRGGGVDVEAKWRSWNRSYSVVDTFLDKYGHHRRFFDFSTFKAIYYYVRYFFSFGVKWPK